MPDNTNFERLNAAFQALTYREMTDLADAFAESIHAQNGLTIKTEVIAEAFDALGEWLLVEAQADHDNADHDDADHHGGQD